MPTVPIDFLSSLPGTPEHHIYDVVQQALRFTSLQDFVAMALAVLEQQPLEDGQFMRIKYAVEWKLNRGFGLNDILAFVFYGNWQDVGLVVNATANALDEEGRSSLMYLLYGVAVGVIQAKIAEMTQQISWQYETPDWVVVPEEESQEPATEPSPDSVIPPDAQPLPTE